MQLERLGRRIEAREELHRTITLDHDHADALNYLGYLNAEESVDLSEAKTMIERAIRLDPGNGAYVDSLGWVYFKMGNLNKAIEYLEQAATLLSTDPTIYDHLGDVYTAHGDVEKAGQAWGKALELNHDLESVKRKMELMQHRQAATP